MKDNIKVSIICNTYNHEKFIAQALDGFVMQKTNFKFEVLVHDDASTDNTAEIIREYEQKYPDLIKPIYQTENQYSKKIPGLISGIQYSRAAGKYIALCEGDDFWSSPYKLQKQYDALENNSDCVMCTVAVEETDEYGNRNGNRYPDIDIPSGKIDSEKMIELMTSKHSYPFQTSGYFFRTDLAKEYHNNLPDFSKKAKVGDVPLMLYFMTKGNLYYIDESMSYYRRNPRSWSYENMKVNNIIRQCKTMQNHIDFYAEFDKYSQYKYHKCINDYIERTIETIAWRYIDNGLYKEALKKPYRKYIPSNKTKIVYYITVYCPLLKKVLNKLGMLRG